MISENVKQNDLLTFDLAFELTKDEVDRILSASPLIIRQYTEHLKSARGKFIRAFSLLTCAMNENSLIEKDAVKLAAAVEILHLATLVHDDVIDNAKTRRGVISLQHKFGKRTAVICGDYLFCVALTLAGSVNNRNDYINFDIPPYMQKLCLGELSQHINNGNFNLTPYRYLKIINGKTAVLFEGSFVAGNMTVKGNEKQSQKLAKLGHYIGMIFQLTDDCIDFEATPTLAKKPVNSDFEQGVITLPLIYAFREQPELKQKAYEHNLVRDEINDAVTKTDGLDFTKLVAGKYYKKAKKIISELECNEIKKEKLTFILDKAYYGLKK